MSACICLIDQDGQCPACRSSVIDRITTLCRIISEYVKKIEEAKGLKEDCCDECWKKYADLGASRVFRAIPGFPSKSALRAMLAAILDQMASEGVTSFPMTELAYREICSENGWDQSL